MKTKVLFLCVGNTARSLMAEAILRDSGGEDYDVSSAGTSAEVADPHALETIRKFELPTEGLESHSVEDYQSSSFDYVITLCDKAREECSNVPSAKQLLAWDFADPKSRDGMLPYETTFKELRERIKIFVTINHKELTAG